MAEKWWLLPRYNRKPPGATKLGPHNMGTARFTPKPICKLCGLVALNNEATRYALKQGCWRYPDE